MSAKGMSLRGKLIAMTVTTMVALAAVFSVLLFNSKNQMMDDRQAMVRSVVEAAHGTLAYYDKEAREGRLSVDDAKKSAAAAVGGMRYGQSEYFWIHDLQHTMIMHPIKPELNGKVLDQLKDKSGKLLFTEMNKVVNARGAGFVDYLWPKPGVASDEGVAKTSYVMGFQPWGWVIGSGLYVDDVEARFRADATKLLIWGAAICGFIGISLMLLSSNILRTLGGDPATASAITRRIAAGDLATPVDCDPNDKDSLLANIRSMQETLRSMIASILDNASQVAHAAQALLAASEDVAKRSSQQSDAASSMAASVEEMAVSIDQVKENAAEAHAISQTAGSISEQGAAVIHNAASEMRKISDAVQASSKIVEELGQQSDQITSIVNTIREIADQTINPAIK